jgi:hypothetical protein
MEMRLACPEWPPTKVGIPATIRDKATPAKYFLFAAVFLHDYIDAGFFRNVKSCPEPPGRATLERLSSRPLREAFLRAGRPRSIGLRRFAP